jgi:acetylornithine deacetylase/succinyl-diaminopimelate desuccinylase-like protein
LAIGAGFSYAVVNAHNGALHLEVEVLRRSAYAARPAIGVDAPEAANTILFPPFMLGAGPRTIEEANAHRADERLPLSDLHKATEVIALSRPNCSAAKRQPDAFLAWREP